MKILISNDDGIHSSGLMATKNALEDIADITIIAPKENNSGIGYKMNIMKNLYLNKLELEDGTEAYELSGTPVDCINLGIRHICNTKPDIVITGINIGMNIGKFNILTSGTVCGAMESARLGVPAIACSQSLDYDYYTNKDKTKIDWKLAQKTLRKIVLKILNEGFPKNIDLFNLNIPSNPISEKIKMTDLTDEMLSLNIETKGNMLMNVPKLKEKHKKGTDGYCILQERRPSLTPLSLNFETKH